MMTMNELSIKQKQTLEAIQYFIKKNKYPPTISELCLLLNNKSKSTVFNKLLQLEDKGYIKTTNGKSRSIVILRGVDDENNIS